MHNSPQEYTHASVGDKMSIRNLSFGTSVFVTQSFFLLTLTDNFQVWPWSITLVVWWWSVFTCGGCTTWEQGRSQSLRGCWQRREDWHGWEGPLLAGSTVSCGENPDLTFSI